jgi:6-phosphogluconolactonase
MRAEDHLQPSDVLLKKLISAWTDSFKILACNGDPMPDLQIASDEDELSRRAARAVADAARAAVARQGRFSLALSGGKTPQKLYARLAEDHRQGLPWDKIHLFWSDERFVPPDHPDSNYRMVRETLLEKVPIPSANLHPVPTQSRTVEEAAGEYERRLKNFFGPVEFPRFDMVLLGLGEDGHTASLFPGTPALAEQKRWAVDVFPPAAPHARVT